MHFFFTLVSTNSFIQRVLSAPPIPALVSRDAVNTSLKPAIETSIIDRGGHDITTSFEIRLYYSTYSPTTVTNNSLSNRQIVLSRPINTCSTGTFYESYCTPEHNIAGSLQSYTTICHYAVPVVDSTGAVLGDFIPNQRVESRLRDGHCADNEICVPGLGAGRSKRGRRMASCVMIQYFVDYLNWGNDRQQGLTLKGMQASMVVSQTDGTTPVEVDTFQVETETTAMSSAQKTSCRDCMALETDQFGARTEGLKVQTRLLTTGAAAGVLWLAIMSG